MPNKTYEEILGPKSKIDQSILEYIQQKVISKNKSSVSIETEYELYLQSKSKSKPKLKDLEKTHKLEMLKVGSLRYSPKVNARWRTETPNDRQKIYSLAAEWNNDYLDAIHVQIINGKNYVGEGMKRAVSAFLNYGPDYKIPCLIDYSMKDESFSNLVVKKQNNIFEKINNTRDRLDSFTYYFTHYVQGNEMAKAVIETMRKTEYNFTPFADKTPVYNGLTTIENIFKAKISGDNNLLSLENMRGPNIQCVFKHHKSTYGLETPHNQYILAFVAFKHHFESDNLRVAEEQFNFVMEKAKTMNVLPIEKNGVATLTGIKTGNDFASKLGLGLKGKSGITYGMKLIIQLWNKCYDNLPEGKKILQSNLDEKYINALVAKGSKANSEYSYSDYCLNPLKGSI
jgi:hypothetical protein